MSCSFPLTIGDTSQGIPNANVNVGDTVLYYNPQSNQCDVPMAVVGTDNSSGLCQLKVCTSSPFGFAQQDPSCPGDKPYLALYDPEDLVKGSCPQ